jgi:maltose alpha-D-glucosyltransferase/alpha-amylase
MTATPSFRVSELPAALSLDNLKALSSDALLGYLRAQRWFGAKGTATSAAFTDVVPLPWDAERLAIGIVTVATPAGEVRYQLPLSVRRVDAASVSGSAPATVIAGITAPDGEAALLDGTLDPVFQKNLGSAFMAGADFESPYGSHWIVQSIAKQPMVFRPDANVRLGSAEQSNTALVYDDQMFLKIFRKLEAGTQPDVEMTRFLTADAGFAHVPTPLGILRYVSADGDSVAGMLQEYLTGSRDAWSYVTTEGSASPSRTMMTDIEQLGRITREMHDALSGEEAEANPDFTPIAADEADVERWAQNTKGMIHQSIGLLEKQLKAGKLSKERVPEAEVLVKRRDHYLSWTEEVADIVQDDAGSRIRIHGDYHLGQVLRTKSDSFVVIDFEGEPTRTLAERREKMSPLKDVAGMLRSLAYAAATLVQGKPGTKLDRRQVAERELIGGRWERDARAAFLRGYTGASQDEYSLLPSDPRRFDALLALFEGEKAFYELAYELNHRPGWEWIPMRGVSQLLRK